MSTLIIVPSKRIIAIKDGIRTYINETVTRSQMNVLFYKSSTVGDCETLRRNKEVTVKYDGVPITWKLKMNKLVAIAREE